jgi:prepilin-type N-terminal cleavage/methylation domain-containing protein/prepilin-type processing-associated H-X9-DG protein
MNKMRKSGFTLLEILVVIAIIALLMAILVPVLDKVRDQARTVICRSKLRHFGLATRMYLDDNDQFFPYPGIWLMEPEGWRTRQCHPGFALGHCFHNPLYVGEKPTGQLWPYLKSIDVLMCPQFAILKKRSLRHEDYAFSYSMNEHLKYISINYLTGYNVDFNESLVYNPAKVVLFTEQNPWTIPGYSKLGFSKPCLNTGWFWVNEYSVDAFEVPVRNFATFHNAPSGNLNEGSANMVFVDGHVGSLKRQHGIDIFNCFRLLWPHKKLPWE